MTALAYSTDTREIARLLEDREAARGSRLDLARKALARRLGCAPGTLESLRKGRLKRIECWLHERLEALLIREIEQEIGRLTRELETYRRTHRDADRSPELARLVEAVRKAQELIVRAPGGGADR